MYVLNHFIYGQFTLGDQVVTVPQKNVANQTNGPDLTGHITLCKTTFKQIPNFIAVDFYEIGSLLQTLAQVNDVPWDGKAATQPPASIASTGSNGGGGGGGGGSSGNASVSMTNGSVESMRRLSQQALSALAVVIFLGIVVL